MYNQYPYLNLNDLNLDYILKAIKEMRYEVTNFVSINAIKYANPIQWNITSQYEKNTIVIDPVTGTAYISVAPVPAGVALTRPEYWTVVFDLGSFVTRAAQNFTSRWESDTTATATFSTPAGGWLVWGDVLYKALVNITAGDAYVVDSNIEHITIEDVLSAIVQDIADEVQARQDADDAINTTIGDLNDLTTTDKTSVVNAINGEVQARQDADGALSDRIDDEVQARQGADDAINTTIGDLNDLTTSDKTSVVNAINETLGTIGSVTGDLSDLVTVNKTNLVNAINEVASKTSVILNVKDYGAVGDGVTNDYAAINAAIAAANTNGLTTIYFPDGKYFCGDGSFVIDTSHIQFAGAANSELVSNGLSDGAFINFTSTYTLEQYNYARVPLKDICITGNYFTDTTSFGVIGVKMGTDSTFISPHCILVNVTIRNFAIGLQLSSAYKSSYLNCTFLANNRGVDVPSAGIQQAVPCVFVTCWWEMNNYGIYALATGYNSISIFGGAFEYNRSIFTGYTKMVYIGTRFEFDARASCDASLNARSVYNQASTTGGVSVSKFIGCFFLELNNYLDNVRYWIANPYMLTSYNMPRIYGLGGNPVTLEFILCEFEGVNSISGYYYIGCDHYYGAGNYSKTIGAANMINSAQVVTSANGFITN